MEVIQTLYEGRPDRNADATEDKAYTALEELHIPFWSVAHDEAYTIADCAAVEAVLEAEIAKNLFLTNAQKTNFFLLVMPGQKPFKTKELSKQIDSARLSFAGAEHMKELLGVSPGSVSIMGLLNDTDKRVRLLIDKDVVQNEWFACHPCRNTASLKMKTSDLLEKLLPATGRKAELVEL